jgi:hypothetical protein
MSLLAPLLLAATLAAAPPSWTATFAPAPLAAALPGERLAVLVVAAGPAASGAPEAAAALEDGLRRSGRTRLVMGDDALGDVTALDDAALVKRAAALPVGLVATVRVFPGAPGEPRTAVVSVYERTGAPVTSFSAREGEPLEAAPAADLAQSAPAEQAPRAPAPEPRAPAAPQAEAQPAPAPAPGPAPDKAPSARTAPRRALTAEEAQAEYDERYLWFEDFSLVNLRTGAPVGGGTNLVMGKYKKPVEVAKFFELVGRQDLVEEHARRTATRTWLFVGSGASYAASLGTLILGFQGPPGLEDPSDNFMSCINAPDFNACNANRDARQAAYDAAERGWQTPMFIASGVTLVAAMGLMYGGLFFNTVPADLPEMRKMADGHNEQLKEELRPGQRGPGTTIVELRLAPLVGPDVSGLMLSGRF